MEQRRPEWEKGSIVRVRSTDEVGKIAEVLAGGRYRVKELPTVQTIEPGKRVHVETLGEIGVFSTEELEPEH